MYDKIMADWWIWLIVIIIVGAIVEEWIRAWKGKK